MNCTVKVNYPKSHYKRQMLYNRLYDPRFTPVRAADPYAVDHRGHSAALPGRRWANLYILWEGGGNIWFCLSAGRLSPFIAHLAGIDRVGVGCAPRKSMRDYAQIQTLHIDNWLVNQHLPEGNGPFPVILLLHGWTGDENAMWVFSSRMPAGSMLLFPRGLYPSPLGGYGWHPYSTRVWPTIDDFRPALKELLALLTSDHFPEADFSHLHVVGFSQGAALVYTFALLQAERINSFAGLSGFLPDGAEALGLGDGLMGKRGFIAHGNQDDLVPVDRARKAVEIFQKAGAQVTYCEDEVGHRLSANCFRGLEAFLARCVQ
jgi:phospholipase/carboxylesterase